MKTKAIAMLMTMLFLAGIFSPVLTTSSPVNEFHMVDIRALMNAPFTPNPMGTDATDYIWLIPGVRTYDVGGYNVPFNIIDPQTNNNRGIVITHGGSWIDPAYLYPKTFEFQIPADLQRGVFKVHFLGMAAGWGCPLCEPFGTLGGILTFFYDDGTIVSQPLRRGLEYDDWAEILYGSIHSALNTIFAESGRSTAGWDTHIDILSVDLSGTSEKSLIKISLTDTGTIAAIPIFAITLESKPKIPATINIDPDTLNLKSNGEWITVYIELPEGYHVADIDLTTVQLEVTSAVTDPKYSFVTDPSQYLVDHDGDGIMERMVKFNRAAVIAYLSTIDFSGETGKFKEVTLKIAGEVAGAPFEGSGTVRVII